MKQNITKLLSIIIVFSAFMVQPNLQAQWAENAVNGEHGNYGYGVTVDDDGNSYIVGRFSATA
ncbi:MAG TPA: hypothetical protein ENK91_07880, partial [Bacteroidetes bacterium]|nr:hypothetical protein [Bacteroidota bacterium]